MNKKRNIRLLIVIVVILAIISMIGFGGASLYSSAKSSRPGDLLFTLKLFMEKEQLDSSKTNYDKTRVLSAHFANRLESFFQLAAEQKCTQLQVADLELELKMNELIRLALTLPGNAEKAEHLQTVHLALARITETQLNCALIKDYGLLAEVYGALVIALDETVIDLSESIKESRESFESYTELIADTEFTEQELVDNSSELLLIARTNLDTASPDSTSSDLEKYVALETNKLIYNNLDKLLETSQPAVFSFEDVTRTICELIPNEPACAESAFESTWNSIKSLPSPQNRISEGRDTFHDYLNKLVLQVTDGK